MLSVCDLIRLQQQIESEGKNSEEAKREVEEDKLLVESIVKEIHRQDQLEMEERERRKLETREMIAEYERLRQKELERRRKAEEKEEEKIRWHQNEG